MKFKRIEKPDFIDGIFLGVLGGILIGMGIIELIMYLFGG